MTSFFVSRYLNEVAPSKQRATILSLRGLSTNVAYGVVSILYSGLIVALKTNLEATADLRGDRLQESVFVASLSWFPLYFLATVAAVFLVHRLRFPVRMVSLVVITSDLIDSTDQT